LGKNNTSVAKAFYGCHIMAYIKNSSAFFFCNLSIHISLIGAAT
jgi:hypothetical protein